MIERFYTFIIVQMCFANNYLEEIPTDIQLKIMDVVNKIKKEELEKVEKLNEKVQFYTEYDEKDLYFARISCNIIYILDNFKDMDLEDEDEFYDEKFRLIDECCDDDFDEDNYDKIKKAVDYFGVFKAMKLGINEIGCDAFDVENTDEVMLYKKCYYHMLYDAFDFTYEEIKLIKDYDISSQ